MEFMLLIYHNEEEASQRPEAEKQRIFQEFAAFTQDITKSGKRKAGGPLDFTPTAATVRVRDGKTMVTDGPFAETKEQLGGYVLVEAKDLRRGDLDCRADSVVEVRVDRSASGE